MPKIHLLVFAFIDLCCFQFMAQDASKTEAAPNHYAAEQLRLITTLTTSKQRDSRVRPAISAMQAINVTIRMNLYQIVDVSEKNQYVVLYCWMTQMWHDSSAAWNPAEYSNISMVVLPYKEIWLPDTYLYNNLAMVREDSERWMNVILQMQHDTAFADVVFRYPALYKFSCNMQVKYFPFDRQYCTMVFGSWTYDSTGIDFFPEQEDVAKEDFSENGEWTLLRFKAFRRLEKYACCPEPFSFIHMELVIKRKPLHYIVNLIIPTVIISLISNVGFFTPTSTGNERNEKVTLGITTLLAYSILLLMISDQMPSTSASIPLIGWFLLGIMVQTSLATLITAIVMGVQRRTITGRRLSARSNRLFFGKLAPILRISPPPLLKTYEYKLYGSPRTAGYTACNLSEENANYATSEHHLLEQCPNGNADQQAKSLPRIPSPKVGSDTGVQAEVQDNRIEKLIIAAEYEWFTAIVDRMCLITSLISVIGLASIVLIIGYIRATFG